MLIFYTQLEKERNFHIFYRVLAGMTSTELEKLHLTKVLAPPEVCKLNDCFCNYCILGTSLFLPY